MAKAYPSSQIPSVTLVTEDDLSISAQQNSDWSYIKTLLPDDYNLFYKWGGGLGTGAELTYSFVDGGAFDYDEKYYIHDYDFDNNGVNDLVETITFLNSSEATMPISFSENEKLSIRESFADWSSLSGLTLTEVADSQTSYGDIRLFNLDFNAWLASGDDIFSGTAAFAYMPYQSTPTLGMDPISGDIIVNSLYQPGDGYFEHVLAHEIGHALGLAHPFEGYYVDDAWTANDSLPTTHTVMTYNGEHRLYGIDPMPYDILAMEFIYGEGEASNTGDDRYDIDPGVVDSYKTEIGQATQSSYSDGSRISIVDDGGLDTVVASQLGNGVFINLQPASWSNLGGSANVLSSSIFDSEIEYTFAQFDSATYSADESAIIEFGQLYISSDTFVENCELTEFADIIFDNKESNIIKCLGGDDRISLSGGIDFVDGGAGNDEVSLFGGIEAYSGSLAGNQAIIEADANVLQQTYGGQNIGASQITLTGVEYVSFYDNQHQVSQRMTLADFLEARPVGEKEEVPMTYEPVIESLAVNLEL